jgi:putative membrane protein
MTLTSHQYWDDGHMFGWSWVAMVVLMVGFWAIIVWLGITLARRPSAYDAPRPPTAVPGGSRPSAAEILAERLARGEIDPDDYRSRLAALKEAETERIG